MSGIRSFRSPAPGCQCLRLIRGLYPWTPEPRASNRVFPWPRLGFALLMESHTPKCAYPLFPLEHQWNQMAFPLNATRRSRVFQRDASCRSPVSARRWHWRPPGVLSQHILAFLEVGRALPPRRWNNDVVVFELENAPGVMEQHVGVDTYVLIMRPPFGATFPS